MWVCSTYGFVRKPFSAMRKIINHNDILRNKYEKSRRNYDIKLKIMTEKIKTCLDSQNEEIKSWNYEIKSWNYDFLDFEIDQKYTLSYNFEISLSYDMKI